ncbi:MAG: hypothetical protein IKN23_08270 [Lactococcus sp.]|nr:hypothetical protein [Lactococcus sp.]
MWTNLFSLGIVCLIMYIGEFISIRSSGLIPQMLIVTLLFLIGFWTILPHDILDKSGIMILSKIIFSIILIDVGTSLDLKEIFKNRQVIRLSSISLLSIILTALIIGGICYNMRVSLSTIPTLTGAGIGAMLMNAAALKANQPYYGAVAMTVFVSHTFISFPFASYFLKKEAKAKLVTLRASKDITLTQPKARAKQMTFTPYRTPTFYLATFFILAAAVEFIALKTHLNSAILQVLTGILARKIGLLQTNSLFKTSSSGLLMIALFASFMQSFSEISFATLLKLLAIAIPLNLSAIGVILVITKRLANQQFSWAMSAAIAMNSFLGFPFNFSLTREAIQAATAIAEEQEALSEQLLPHMILASTFSVSLMTPFIASICIKLLY